MSTHPMYKRFFNARKNPANNSLSPFAKYQTTDENSDLSIGRHTMTVLSSAAMKRAARILVDVFHIPLAPFMVLTRVVEPYLRSGDDDYLTIVVERAHGVNYLEFKLYVESPIASDVRDLRAAGFGPPENAGAYTLFVQEVYL